MGGPITDRSSRRALTSAGTSSGTIPVRVPRPPGRRMFTVTDLEGGLADVERVLGDGHAAAVVAEDQPEMGGGRRRGGGPGVGDGVLGLELAAAGAVAGERASGDKPRGRQLL